MSNHIQGQVGEHKGEQSQKIVDLRWLFPHSPMGERFHHLWMFPHVDRCTLQKRSLFPHSEA